MAIIKVIKEKKLIEHPCLWKYFGLEEIFTNRDIFTKFRDSHAIGSLIGLLPSCQCAFVGPKFFLVGFSWVQVFSHEFFVGSKFFSWVFHQSKIFLHGHFVGPKLFLLGISWIQSFSSSRNIFFKLWNNCSHFFCTPILT